MYLKVITRRKTNIPGHNRQRGTTLLELVVVLAIISILTSQGVQFLSDKFRNDAQERNVRALSLLSQASMARYADTGGVWPTNVNDLVPEYLPVFRNGNSEGLPFTFASSLPTPTVSRPPLRISTTFQTLDAARDLASRFGNTATLTGTTVTFGVAAPGTEISHDQLIPRDGSRDVFGDLQFNGANIDLGNNRIFNADRITVTQPDNSGLVLADSVSADTMTAQTFIYTPIGGSSPPPPPPTP